MYRYIPQTKKLCINALATATMFGVVSLAIAQPLRGVVNRSESKDKVQKIVTVKKPIKVEPSKNVTEDENNRTLNSQNIRIIETSENDGVIFNEIGYRVPKEYYIDNEK